MEPQYKPFKLLHGMILRIAYTVYDDPDKSFFQGKTSMASILIDDCYDKISCLPMSKDAFSAQEGFNRIENSNTLLMKFYDFSRSAAIVEKIDYTLKAWLEMKLLKSIQCSTYLSHPTRWWDCIESDFKSIFGPIVSGVRILHCHGKYHGNLLNGIAISIPEPDGPREFVKGVLFGMSDQTENLSAEALRSRQSDDIKDLIHLINYASTYPFMRADPKCQPPSPPSIIQVLILQQLEDRISSIQMSPRCMRTHWDLNPAGLWKKREMIDFLLVMYRMLFKCRSTKHIRKTVTSAFVNKDWVKQVKECGAQNVVDVLNRDLNAQKSGMGKLRFYRNCIEYMIPDNV